MTKCYAYIRVSTVKQGEGASLEAQTAAIKRYAAQNNLTITRWFEEKETAAKTGRPVFGDVIKNLKRGHARGLVVHKIDRSARNFRDWALIGDLADLGIEIHFATESLDFSSRGGRLAADIQAVVAADYIRNLREEARKGLNMRLEQGLYPFKAPLGYLDTGRGNPKTICPTKGPLVRTMFELYASGEYSFWSLPEEMTRRGLTNARDRALTKTNVEKILKNPFYTGLVVISRSGRRYQGVHEPLISQTLFRAVQAMRGQRDNHKSTKHNHLFRGLVQCKSCKRSLIGELQKGRVYYRCHTKTCRGVSIRQDVLDHHLQAMLQRLVLRPEHLEALRRAISRYLSEHRLSTRVQEAEFEIAKIAARLDTLLDHHLDGVINRELFEAKQASLQEDKMRWQEIKRVAEETAGTQAFAETFLAWTQSLPDLYRLAPNSEKRALAKLATSNCVLDGKSLELEPSNWLCALTTAADVSFGDPDSPKARIFVREFIGVMQITSLKKIMNI